MDNELQRPYIDDPVITASITYQINKPPDYHEEQCYLTELLGYFNYTLK